MSRGRALLAIAVVGTLALPAGAAKLPDWAQAVADAAPPVPVGVPEHPARVLLRETRLEVDAKGTIRIRHRRVVQALGVRSEGVGVGWFAAGGERKTVRSRAWHLPPGERAEKTKQAMEISVGDSFLDDSAARMIAVDGVKKGSVVAFEFEAVESPYVLAYREPFFDSDGPIDRARLEVALPPGWTVRHEWLHAEGVEPRPGGGGVVFELDDLPALPVDDVPYAPDPDESMPELVLGFSPPDGSPGGAVPSVPTWASLGAWYQKTAAGRDAAGPEVRAACASERLPADADFAARVLATSRHVRDRVRYVAREMGIGGYQPRPAEDTARDLVGDCKDKGTLLVSMLAEEGIVAHPLLVHASERGTVAREVPDLHAFNHVVVAVDVPGDASLPDAWASAVVPSAGGRVLVVDATSEYNAVGTIPVALSGTTGLLVEGEGSRLFDLPEASPDAHRIEHRVSIERADGGGYRIVDVRSAYGWPGSSARASHRNDPLDRRRDREREIRSRWPDATVESYEVAQEADDGSFRDTLSFRISPRADQGPFPIFAPLGDEIGKLSLRRRKVPVEFRGPLRVVVETEYPDWPEGAPAPPESHAKGEGWSVDSTFDPRGGKLKGTIDVTLARRRFEPAQFPDLKAFYDAISSASAVPVAYRE